MSTRRIGGLDLGQKTDFSCLISLKDRGTGGWIVERIDRPPMGLAFRDQLELLHASLDRLDCCAVDTGGTGQAVPELMDQQLRIVPVVIAGGSAPAKQTKGRVTIGKATLTKGLLRLIRSGLLRVDPAAPGRDQLRQELVDFSYVESSGFRRMEARRGHDDTVMALALAVWLAGLQPLARLDRGPTGHSVESGWSSH